MGNETARFSSGLTPIDPAGLSQPIRDALVELGRLAGGGCPPVYHWNANHVGIPLEVSVDLPTRGPVDDLDIRATEPVLILLHRRHYPMRAPLAYSDRKDFPAERLPHLNPTTPGSPASLCLHRGSLDDWFAEHGLKEFLGRIRGWLRDAARNRLIREEDLFEGTRIQESAGIIVYDPEVLDRRVVDHWGATPEVPGQAYFAASILKDPLRDPGWESKLSLQIDAPLEGPPGEKLIDLFLRWNRLGDRDPTMDRLVFGLALWPAQQENPRYFGHLPRTFGELQAFAEQLGLPLGPAVEEYRGRGAQVLNGIPICLAVLRPTPVLGTQSRLEWLNFIVLGNEEARTEGGQLKPDAHVFVLSHRRPLTTGFAADLSGTTSRSPMGKVAIIGCGAVGSKVSLHLAKSGATTQLLVDESTLSPHHLVRHGLPAGHVGKNKAEGVKEEILAIFKRDAAGVAVDAIAGSAYDLFEEPGKLAECAYLLDASASAALLNALANFTGLRPDLRVCRCEIADLGKLGIFICEGASRNPRLDDLQVQVFDFGRSDTAVSAWLQRHRASVEAQRGPALEEIGIGISCSSSTQRLADDIVSLHAAQFALALKNPPLQGLDQLGRLQISFLALENGVGAATRTFLVPPVTVLEPPNAPGWAVRLAGRAAEELTTQMRRAGRNETGGLLVGLVHRKRRVIYVTHVLPPSRDSQGSPYAFKRGVADYPKILDQIEGRTGGLLGYVGEWHTHPRGPAEPSDTDLQAVSQIRANLDHIRLPTHILIRARDGLASYVFGA